MDFPSRSHHHRVAVSLTHGTWERKYSDCTWHAKKINKQRGMNHLFFCCKILSQDLLARLPAVTRLIFSYTLLLLYGGDLIILHGKPIYSLKVNTKRDFKSILCRVVSSCKRGIYFFFKIWASDKIISLKELNNLDIRRVRGIRTFKWDLWKKS